MKSNIQIYNQQFLMESDDEYLNVVGDNFEADIVSIFQKLINTDDVVFDIGANIGMTSLAFHQMSSKVYSFEPSPSTFDILEKNVKRAKVDNIELYNIGLGNENTDMTITFSENNRSGGFVSNTTKLERGHITENIKIKKLDDFVNTIEDIPTFIKIDVEGFERQVIEGGLSTLLKYHPIVFMEMNHFCLNVLHRTNIPDFLEYMLSIFTYLYAIGDNNTLVELHDDIDRYSVMHEHVVNNKFQNLIGCYDEIDHDMFLCNDNVVINKIYKNEDTTRFLKSGWSTFENNFTWSDGNLALIELPLSDDIKDNKLNLVILLMPFDQQNAIFNVNGIEIESCYFDKEKEIILEIDTKNIQDNLVMIEITLPNSKSPKELNMSEDRRKLGLAIKSFEIRL